MFMDPPSFFLANPMSTLVACAAVCVRICSAMRSSYTLNLFALPSFLSVVIVVVIVKICI